MRWKGVLAYAAIAALAVTPAHADPGTALFIATWVGSFATGGSITGILAFQVVGMALYQVGVAVTLGYEQPAALGPVRTIA